MIDYFKTSAGFRQSENGFQHFCNSFRAINMHRRFAPQQPERSDKPGQSETVIAMKMRNKNMIYFRKSAFRFSKLHLCSLATIDQKMPFLHFQQLCCRCRIYRGYSGIESENGKIGTQKMVFSLLQFRKNRKKNDYGRNYRSKALRN